jgi:hypothetical protein
MEITFSKLKVIIRKVNLVKLLKKIGRNLLKDKATYLRRLKKLKLITVIFFGFVVSKKKNQFFQKLVKVT